jgi:hypothetical protein
MLKIVVAAGLLAGVASAAQAAELGTNDNAKSQGSLVGVYSSQVTGNGAAIGGGTNGTGQTQSPGSRAAEVQAIHAAEGKGSQK